MFNAYPRLTTRMPGIRRHGGIGAYVTQTTPSGDELVFHAATYDPDTYELTQELVGAGGETCTHTSTIYSPDYLGVYHAFGANEPVWEGFRESAGQYYADDGTGTLLDPLPMQVYQEAATNALPYSEDLSQWDAASGPTVLQNRTSLTGVANGAWEVTDASAGTHEQLTLGMPGATSAASAIKLWVEKDLTATDFSSQINTTNPTVCRLEFNVATGEYFNRDSATLLNVTVVDNGSNFLIGFDVVGVYSSITLHPAITTENPPTGSAEPTAIGSVGFLQTEVHDGKSIEDVRDLGPIFTTTTAVSTDETIITHAAANHDNAEGTYTGTIDYAGDDADVLSLGGVPFLYIEDAPVSGKQLTLSDGTNQVSEAITAGEHEFEAHYNAADGEMQLTLDAATSAITTYDETLGTGDITVGETGRDFKRLETSEIV